MKKNNKDYLMDENSMSDLAYNLFTRGSLHHKLGVYMNSHNITCPEDLFWKLRKESVKSISKMIGIKFNDDDLGDYHFRKNKMTIPEIVKSIEVWKESAISMEGTQFFKVIDKFEQDCCFKWMILSNEYRNAEV